MKQKLMMKLHVYVNLWWNKTCLVAFSLFKSPQTFCNASSHQSVSPFCLKNSYCTLKTYGLCLYSLFSVMRHPKGNPINCGCCIFHYRTDQSVRMFFFNHTWVILNISANDCLFPTNVHLHICRFFCIISLSCYVFLGPKWKKNTLFFFFLPNWSHPVTFLKIIFPRNLFKGLKAPRLEHLLCRGGPIIF